MIKKDDYKLLFQIETNHLISDLFCQYYKKLECLLISKDRFWKSYLPVQVIGQTLTDGVEIYSNTVKFNEYKRQFEEYKNSTPNKLEEIVSKDLSTESIIEYLQIISEVWKYYSKTEFFYTDKVAKKLLETKDSELENNLKELEQIKNDGRSFMNSLIFIPNSYLDKLLILISNKIKANKDDLKWYSVEELSQQTIIDTETVEIRKKFYCMVSIESSIQYVYSETDEFLQFFVSEDKKEIRGVVANKGIVRGKVKIIPPNYYADFSILKSLFEEMDKGDILVAETTSPELMTACSKAGAIITNQGGLLSHAAIVSRELNIPCIIGTGNATEILKDGYEVEVNANDGFVKILNKN